VIQTFAPPLHRLFTTFSAGGNSGKRMTGKGIGRTFSEIVVKMDKRNTGWIIQEG
jgi:hypothetical protein